MRFLIFIIASVILSYAVGFYLAIPANPEIQFWKEVMERRDCEIAEVRKNQPQIPIIFFTGGSSTAFSIDPEIIEHFCGLPAFNLGLPVACGREYLLHQALDYTRPGDVLVVCLEPDVLTSSLQESSPSKLSFALATTRGQPGDSTGGSTFNTPLTLPHWLNLTRPGAGYSATLAARIIARKPYRYTPRDIQYRGHILTEIRDPNPNFSGSASATSLAPDARKMLQTFVRAAVKKGVRIAYSMPWRLTSEDFLATNRALKKAVLADINKILPVVDDGYTGAMSDPLLFSDTPQHLSAEGAAARSQALAISLQEWLYKL